jgi:sortase A
MSGARSSSHRLSLVAMVSLGSIVVGVACIGWALINIRADSVPSVPFQARSTGDGAVSTASVDPSGTVAKKVVYPKDPPEGQTLGSLSIPALKQAFRIIQGTRTDDLKKGVGHMTQTALPGQADNCVLSGHRDTVFSGLGALKIRDRLIVQTAAGTFTYQISRIRIVHKNDRTVVVHADRAVLTVSTCYPFHYVGSAPDRYVLVADLVAPR